MRRSRPRPTKKLVLLLRARAWVRALAALNRKVLTPATLDLIAVEITRTLNPRQARGFLAGQRRATWAAIMIAHPHLA